MAEAHRTNGLFITGTDTGVGKTVVAAGLVRLFRNRGIRCVAVKPVETGCRLKDGMLHPEDGTVLVDASEGDISLDECVPLRFSLPASPARAAAMEGARLHVDDLVEHVRTLAESVDLIAVEGAGGLMVPIEQGLMMIDLMERLAYPVMLVARTRLGTVNHTLLSVEALQRRGIEIAGIVLSGLETSVGPEEQFTPKDIARFATDVPIVVLPYLSREIVADPERIASVMEESWPQDFLERCTEHITR